MQSDRYAQDQAQQNPQTALDSSQPICLESIIQQLEQVAYSMARNGKTQAPSSLFMAVANIETVKQRNDANLQSS